MDYRATIKSKNKPIKKQKIMQVEFKDGEVILKEVYNSVTIETNEGKQLYVCLRDYGFEMKIDNGEWHLITNESDFKPNNH
jgi:RNase P/RNase MRP subunit p29